MGARFARNIPSAQESFWKKQMVLLGDEDEVEARFCLFGDSGNLDTRWMHGLRRTGSKIILDAPDRTPR